VRRIYERQIVRPRAEDEAPDKRPQALGAGGGGYRPA